MLKKFEVVKIEVFSGVGVMMKFPIAVSSEVSIRVQLNLLQNGTNKRIYS